MSWQCLFWLFQRLPFRLCLTTLLNVASGPWQGAAMFGNISASAATYFSSASYEDPLFGYFYEDIAREAGLWQRRQHAGAFCSPAHERRHGPIP